MAEVRVGLDLDGCVYDWVGATKVAFRERGYDGPGWEGNEIPTWNWMLEEGGVTSEDWRWLWETKTGLLGCFGQLDMVYPGSIDAVRAISKKTDLAVITHRPRRVAPMTARLLAHHSVTFDSLHILGPRSAKSAVTPQCDVYIEDKIENVLDFLENTEAKKIYVPRRPWSEDERLEDDPRVAYFTNWNKVASSIGHLVKRAAKEASRC